MRVLFLSTPSGALGTGLSGGVEALITTLAEGLVRRGHLVAVVAPEGSRCPGAPVVEVAGRSHAGVADRHASVSIHPDSVLMRMWEVAKQMEHQQDLIVNFGFDWLPYYLGPFFQTPVLHFATLSAPDADLARFVDQVARRHPLSVAVHSRAQAESFGPSEHYAHLSYGIDLECYRLNLDPEPVLCWAGRIAPEKGLEDAFAVAEQLGLPLRIMGVEQDPEYFAQIRRRYPHVDHAYLGLLPHDAFQRELGRCQAFLMTPKWVEAMGIVALEAMACGTPVVAYRKGGPAETIIDGLSGYLVEPDSPDALAKAAQEVHSLDRHACRALVEKSYSLAAFLDRAEAWLNAHLPSRALRARYSSSPR